VRFENGGRDDSGIAMLLPATTVFEPQNMAFIVRSNLFLTLVIDTNIRWLCGPWLQFGPVVVVHDSVKFPQTGRAPPLCPSSERSIRDSFSMSIRFPRSLRSGKRRPPSTKKPISQQKFSLITDAIAGDFKDSFYPASVQALMSQGRSYGLPDSVGPIVFWYNKELCEKAGVDPSEIKYWEDFLEAVKKCKAAHITPIAVGGTEKWPLQFYPALLMMRILGKDGMASAYKGNNGGFAGPEVLKAWKMYKELCDLDPLPRRFSENDDSRSSWFFPRWEGGVPSPGWRLGSWVGQTYAADKQGLPDAKLGWFLFPELQGGKGKANDIFGSIYGWLVSKDAPKEVIDFMKVWLGKDVQTKLAAEGLSIPMVIGTADAIQNPFYKALALEVNKTGWIGLAMDQLLGRETGRVFNDEAVAVAAGAESPEQATQSIENSWSQNRI
jgi:raffinose/stachyose/melibiose transport system substrate-binding protein